MLLLEGIRQLAAAEREARVETKILEGTLLTIAVEAESGDCEARLNDADWSVDVDHFV